MVSPQTAETDCGNKSAGRWTLIGHDIRSGLHNYRPLRASGGPRELVHCHMTADDNGGRTSGEHSRQSSITRIMSSGARNMKYSVVSRE